MSSELTNERLIELIERYETWPKDTNAFLTELLERRKAEQCPTCKGIGAPWNNSSSVPCESCHGTGKQGNAELIAALRDQLAWLKSKHEHAPRKHINPNENSYPTNNHPSGWCAICFPDWDVRQKIDSLEQDVARAEGKRV